MKIVVLDANSLGTDIDLSVIEQLGTLEIYGFTAPDEVVGRISSADVIITNKVTLGQENLSLAPSVKLICLTATGSNNVDKVYARENHIIVSNVIGYSTESVAQHTFAMLFYLYEKLAFYDRYVKEETYVNDVDFSHFTTTFHEISGKTWGIVGLGNIGMRVAQIAEVFGCQVVYHSTSGKNLNQKYPHLDLKTLCEKSDIISVHAPLNEQTQYLFNEEVFGWMRASAVFLNLGRGLIVEEEALVNALNSNQIAAAGIDVLIHEPMIPTDPLLSIKDSNKLFVTPHIAWSSIEARQTVVKEVYKNIEAFQKGEPRNECLN